VVDHVTEIPLPGRTICRAESDSPVAPPRVAVTAFVAGPENRLAASSVSRLLDANEERAVANTLAIHGTSGTGKTHLARGLVQSWQDRFGADSAEYLTAADFRHTLTDAIKNDDVVEFRRRIRGRKLLAIDDIDRLPPTPHIQSELRYTIDELNEAGAMIVVTSSTPASAARNLSLDVRSRLAAGLELRLAPPEEAARRQIARHVSAALGRPLSEAAAHRLAAGVTGTAGDVFGALFELNNTHASPGETDLDTVEKFLAGRAARRPTMRDILPIVAKYYRISQKVLKSGSRRQSTVTARAMAVYLARELSGLSYERIGQALGGRDHTTIMHNYRKIAEALQHNAATRDALTDLERQLQLAT
jgi:chromosomal replication initiator protein